MKVLSFFFVFIFGYRVDNEFAFLRELSMYLIARILVDTRVRNSHPGMYRFVLSVH